MIHSKKYTDAARGQPCTLQIPGICNGDWSTTVAAHIRDEFKGTGNKASDISILDACHSCHAKFDGQLGEPLSRDEWLFYALRGIQRTLENRFAQGILFVPADPKKRKSGKKVRSGKPIQSRGFPKAKRKMNDPFFDNSRDVND
ncbi:uncharacterized protein DUF1364 [Maritalea mobilis]|uniref:Uncharacterized protein DUF1364 n=1 Tax=Maritalea mobilis TaxID=483324 RepID=A0A4R6VN46_9HYPH|nr:nuclease domain-containing protein [Maritalea mobilis]TDQ63616.1 uncharacterized protein DUF1364 [Maritalea mobilis]